MGHTFEIDFQRPKFNSTAHSSELQVKSTGNSSYQEDSLLVYIYFILMHLVHTTPTIYNPNKMLHYSGFLLGHSRRIFNLLLRIIFKTISVIIIFATELRVTIFTSHFLCCCCCWWWLSTQRPTFFPSEVATALEQNFQLTIKIVMPRDDCPRSISSACNATNTADLGANKTERIKRFLKLYGVIIIARPIHIQRRTTRVRDGGGFLQWTI